VQTCPNCSAALNLGVTECVKCGAYLGPGHSWGANPSKNYSRNTVRIALILWLLSWLSPAGRVGGRLVWGWELALHSFNPLLLLFQPLAFLAAFTNIVFIVQASRVARRQRANPAAVGICLLLNITVLVQGVAAKDASPLSAHVYSVAPWLWAASFLFLLAAVLPNEA
jgi:hypothetical protein